MSNIMLRDAVMADAPRLLEIYSYYVENTAISFEYIPPSLQEFQVRMERIIGKYPYLVVECEGTIEGYAYAAPFHSRAAYGWCCESTIYLDRASQKRGLGRMLYEELLEQLQAMGILNVYACVAFPHVADEYLTTNSYKFHRHLGFEEVARMHYCGYKFGRWYDMTYLEKIIGEHDDVQAEVVPYCRVRAMEDE